jgi:hypothetical protein
MLERLLAVGTRKKSAKCEQVEVTNKQTELSNRFILVRHLREPRKGSVQIVSSFFRSKGQFSSMQSAGVYYRRVLSSINDNDRRSRI